MEPRNERGSIARADARSGVPWQFFYRCKVPGHTYKSLRQWLANQKSDDEALREKSEKELAKMWRGAAAQLKKAHEDAFDVGTKGRLGALLLWTQRPIHLPETLQRMRAIETLEHIGTPAAIQVLERMAQGGELYPETEDAKESLERVRQAKKLAAPSQ